MATYGLYKSGETRKDGEARVGFVSCEAADIDSALATLMPTGSIPSASNAPSHEKHDPAVRRFSHGGQSFRVAPTVATTKAPTKSDIARDNAVLSAMIAVLAKKAKLSDESLATLRAECESQIP